MATNNPYETPTGGVPILPETSGSKMTSLASWIAIFAPLLMQMMLTCACGHLHLFLLPVTLGNAGLAFFVYSKPESRTVVGLIGLAIAILFLGKHMGDILWLGHEPLLPFQ